MVGYITLIGIVACLGVCLWLGATFWFDQRVSLTIVNHAGIPTDASVLQVDGPIYDPEAPISTKARTSPLVAVDAVTTGRTAMASERTGRDIGWSVVRVRIGEKTYEGGGTTLLDHHGPHVYTVEVYDDRVVMTHQSSRRTSKSELREVPPATTSPRRLN